MDFYKWLKYGAMVVFAIILAVGAYLAADEPPVSTQTVPQTGSKFNF